MEKSKTTIRHVTSPDGTRIGYLQYGQGPGLFLVQGAMGTAYNYKQLAEALADTFTVYVPDRRGRGMSPREYNPDHTIERDVEDLETILAKTGAHFVFGLSSGAIITMEALRVLPSIHKAVIYEPPFLLQSLPNKLVTRFNTEILKGKLAAALVTASKIVRLTPPVMNAIPRPLLEIGTALMIRAEHTHGSGLYTPLKELLPSMRYDFKVLLDRAGKVESFKTLKQEVLLMGGTKSPTYLKDALGALEKAIPHAHRVELEGLDHSGAWNSDKGGHPETVAKCLIEFFSK